MLRNLLAGMGGISLYGVISMLLFVCTFSAAMWVVLRMSRQHVESMSRLPLEDGAQKGAPRHE